MQLLIKTQTGKRFVIHVDSYDTIKFVKSQIKEIEGNISIKSAFVPLIKGIHLYLPPTL